MAILVAGSRSIWSGEFGQHGLNVLLGIAEQHPRVRFEEQRIFHAGVARCHGPFQRDHRFCIPDLQHGHAGDRALRILESARIDDVIRADHEGLSESDSK